MTKSQSALAALVLCSALAGPALATSNTFLVTNTNDSGPGSLRYAIDQANSNGNPFDTDKIEFNIPGPCPCYIHLHEDPADTTHLLPSITQRLWINGTSQSEYAIAGKPVIVLDGSQAGLVHGAINLQSFGSTVDGLAIVNVLGSAIELYADQASVTGNHVGVDPTGTFAQGNLYGIVFHASNASVIGGNVVSGNYGTGIVVSGNGNWIENNYVGTNADGTMAVGNGGIGIELDSAANANVLGNVVSGNGLHGIVFSGHSAGGNVAQANKVGTNKAGTASVPNFGHGVLVDSANDCVIGGDFVASIPTMPARNIISGNIYSGVRIVGAGATGNWVHGNFIGLNATASGAVPNSDGVRIEDAPDNLIGMKFESNGPGWTGTPNLISGNFYDGVAVTGSGADGNIVQMNLIGTNDTAQVAVPNGGAGIGIYGAPDTFVKANTISGNGGAGVLINSLAATGTNLLYNKVGVGLQNAPLANHGSGVRIAGQASGNYIYGNTIANNGTSLADAGVLVESGRKHMILANNMYANTGLGIDLAPAGVTFNDLHDWDTGPNDLQNYPILVTAKTGGGVTTVSASHSFKLSSMFRIDFFVNDQPDGSGYGEGQAYLTYVTVMTSPDPHPQGFTVDIPAVPVGKYLSATATDMEGNTSEFSNAVQVTIKYTGRP